ncbi:hypothetical protein C7389_11612 [Azoarcus indigens]|uniref:DUF2946 family protein n=1 Tax=Azoarcus indigens TaxID=29545 RepID=A0A4R6DUX8_9RHOO|nr:hypothetical protein C7389_11612 [Azoarcus indigens]
MRRRHDDSRSPPRPIEFPPPAPRRLRTLLLASMPLSPGLQRLSSWLAILAILLTVLAPGISKALAARDAGWMEVCTAAGIKHLQAGGGSPDESGHAGSSGSCPYCLTHAFGFALAPVDAQSWPALAGPAGPLPLAAALPPAPVSAWTTPQPRAPPSA